MYSALIPRRIYPVKVRVICPCLPLSTRERLRIASNIHAASISILTSTPTRREQPVHLHQPPACFSLPNTESSTLLCYDGQLMEAKIPRQVSVEGIMTDVNMLGSTLLEQTVVARNDVMDMASKEADKVIINATALTG